MCTKFGIECTGKWYDDQPLPGAENGEVRITWDMTIYTEHHQDWGGKVEKYQELASEIWGILRASKVTILPVVIGALTRRSESAYKDLVRQAQCTWLPWKCTIIGHSWNCSPVAESVVSLSYEELLRHNQHYPAVEELERTEQWWWRWRWPWWRLWW